MLSSITICYLNMKYCLLKNCVHFYVCICFQEVYRLNLEIGQFLAPYVTKANEINCCAVNEEHGLLILGTESGHVEAWDPRTKSRQGILDCALHCTDSEYT